VVTGGARGIGRAICQAYADEGANVVVADVVDGGGRATADAIVQSGGRAEAVVADVTSVAQVDALIEQALAITGRIEVLVNNAAIYDGIRAAPLETLTTDEWDRVLAVNVRGVWNATRAVVVPMRSQGYGKIVNLASGTVIQGTPFSLHYVASKGAVVAMTRAVARELGPDGIRVNALAPGLTDSGAKKVWEVPEGRGGATSVPALPGPLVPFDLVGTAVFLAAAESDAMTGQLLAVNRGTGFVG
jgi:NAD(P)-dependent dehydrogenase (short-subunit alcohol dehydrogenase family)